MKVFEKSFRKFIQSEYEREWVGVVVVMSFVFLHSSAFGSNHIGLFDVWEVQVTNSKKYSNPFDFNVIELRARFISPDGHDIDFFGFYDGNGRGGQNGHVWKLRFMPDKVGTWTYRYTWSDGTPGGAGSFTVSDTGLPGPLKVGTDNPWYFMNGRDEPFHFRGYDMHHDHLYAPTDSYLTYSNWIQNMLREHVINQGYNITMWDGPSNRLRRKPEQNDSKDTWWLTANTEKRFNIPVWHAFEETLRLAKKKKVYVMTFAGMLYQGGEYPFEDFKVFLRYWVARFGAFYNFFGWSPTWEWHDIWNATEANQIMTYVHDLDPWKRLLSIHDCSHSIFAGWLNFTMRQTHTKDLFRGNSRQAPWDQMNDRKKFCGDSGLASKFLNMPIIASEDIWELPESGSSGSGAVGHASNRTEVRRAAWGIQMAGVMALYSEWSPWMGGTGKGEPDIRRMFDFFYSKTTYRKYQQLNSLVSHSQGQIASGIPQKEYLVYDEDGGTINIDLSRASSSFSVLWYNPTTSQEQSESNISGGTSQTLHSPFSGDSVLLLQLTSSTIKE